MNASMESHCLPFSKIPHPTKLFSTFAENFDKVAAYYGEPPSVAGVLAARRKIELDEKVRREVVEILREQNEAFGTGPDTVRNLERLAKGAAAIVTGQQVGLFAGPAYSLYKAISVVRYAEEITKAGVDSVPVFWLATEDHDFAEINHVAWNSKKGLAEFELGERESDAGRHVGEIKLGAPVTALVAKAVGSLEGSFGKEIAEALRESYTREETYGSAFGKLMARLMAGRGIIFLDPLDPRFHRLAAGVYWRALDEAEALRTSLIARSKELDKAGYHAQVKVTEESTLLFYNVDGRRQPLRVRNGKFTAGRASFSLAELQAAIKKTPELFTPNVLLRPIVQDTLLPTAAYIGGAAEIAYMAQAQVVYDKLLGRMPAILSRAGFTIIEPFVARLLTKFGLDISDVFRGHQHLRARMEQKALPRALASRFDAGEKTLRKLLKSYQAPLTRLDRTLVGALDSAESKMLHQFAKLKGKAARAENLRIGVLDRYERILLDSLYPHRALQERTLSPLPWLAAYGPSFVDKLSRQASIESAQHHVVYL
jgi:bacillithiol biosynthesis cysteine-adding enzyme BshC